MARSTAQLTKSDTANHKFNYVLAGTGGSLVIGQEGGNQVTLTDVPANVWFPVGNATHILTSSTADNLLVF